MEWHKCCSLDDRVDTLVVGEVLLRRGHILALILGITPLKTVKPLKTPHGVRRNRKKGHT